MRLKDSGYIPNNANRPLAVGMDKAAASSALSEELGERNEVVCALGEEGDSEERREFVRGVLALIHVSFCLVGATCQALHSRDVDASMLWQTDKEFVDGLWRRYRETMGKAGNG